MHFPGKGKQKRYHGWTRMSGNGSRREQIGRGWRDIVLGEMTGIGGHILGMS